jgi:hypothetical protein
MLGALVSMHGSIAAQIANRRFRGSKRSFKSARSRKGSRRHASKPHSEQNGVRRLQCWYLPVRWLKWCAPFRAGGTVSLRERCARRGSADFARDRVGLPCLGNYGTIRPAGSGSPRDLSAGKRVIANVAVFSVGAIFADGLMRGAGTSTRPAEVNPHERLGAKQRDRCEPSRDLRRSLRGKR